MMICVVEVLNNDKGEGIPRCLKNAYVFCTISEMNKWIKKILQELQCCHKLTISGQMEVKSKYGF